MVQMFSHEFYKFFRNNYFAKHLRTAASKVWSKVSQNLKENTCAKVSFQIRLQSISTKVYFFLFSTELFNLYSALLVWFQWSQQFLIVTSTSCVVKVSLNSSVIRQKCESQNGCLKKTARQIFQKTNMTYPVMGIRTCACQGVRNIRFSENLACFVFLKHPF